MSSTPRPRTAKLQLGADPRRKKGFDDGELLSRTVQPSALAVGRCVPKQHKVQDAVDIVAKPSEEHSCFHRTNGPGNSEIKRTNPHDITIPLV